MHHFIKLIVFFNVGLFLSVANGTNVNLPLKTDDKMHLFVVSGVVVNSNNSKKIEQLIQMIANKSGYKLKPFYVNSYEHLSKTLRENPDALAWTCGAPYVEDHIKDGQQLVVVPLFNKTPTYSSFIVSRKGEPQNKLTDFKSKIFVYSDARSNSGFIAPSILLKEAGFTMENFFRVKVHAGVHEKSIDAIYNGVADVGAIDEYVWDEYRKIKPYIVNELQVIETIGPYPFTPIVAGKAVNIKTIKALQQSLTQLSAEEKGQLKSHFNLDGFVVKTDEFYLPIKENLIAIGIKLPSNNRF